MALNLDLLLVAGGRLASAVLALIGIRIATSVLAPGQYGELALLVTVQSFCGLFLINPVGQYINLHTHKWWDDGTLATRLKSYRSYVFLVALIGGGLVLPMSFHQDPAHLGITVASLVLMVAASTWNATLIPMMNMLGLRVQSVIWSLLTTAISIIASVALTSWSISASAWLSGQAIGMLAGVLGAKKALSRHPKYLPKRDAKLPLFDRKTAVRYCVPLSIATGLMWLQLSGYRFVIDTYWGLAQLGLMVIGLQLANQVFCVAESIASQFFHPIFYRQINDQADTDSIGLVYSDLLNTLVPLYFLLTGLILMTAPYLLKLLVASKFQDAVIFIKLGAVIELCRTLGNLLSIAAHATRKTNSLVAPYAAGAVTAIALTSLAGVLNMPIMMSGIALTIGAVAMLGVMWQRMGIQIDLTPDLIRWTQAAMVMLVMSALPILLPSKVEIWAAFGILVLSTNFSIICGLVILWKNPAVKRLLKVKLKKDNN